MKIVIFGLGSIGQRHARILQQYYRHELFVFRRRSSKKNSLGIKEIYTWDEVSALKADIALITNPTFLHLSTATACAKLGMHLFIEKPLSHELKGLKELEAVCKKNKVSTYVAYCLRFHPVIIELRRLLQNKKIQHVRVTCSSFLPSWRQGTDSKNSYSAVAAQGGGVLLDLSHEIDYLGYLLGDLKVVASQYGKASKVTVDAEDFADVIFSSSNAASVNLHLNFLSRFNERRIIVDHDAGCIVADLLANTVEVISGNTKKLKKFKVTRDEYFKGQMDYFLKNIGRPMMNDLTASKATLATIMEIKRRG